jgi:predicted TIM-barrel fold metal-dependent hydrolase
MIVSADGHAGAPGRLYRDYLDPEFRDLFDDFVRQSREMQKAMFAERDNNASRKKWRVKWYEETGDGGERVAYDSDERNAALDEDGVVAEVLFPDADASGLGWSEVVGAPFGSGLSSSGDSDPRLVFAGARAHNRWLADFCHESPERRAGIALVPIVHDIEAGLSEIRRAKESGLHGGIMIPTRWMEKAAYHDPVYDAIWELCVELDMPVHTHSGSGPTDLGANTPVGIYSWEAWWWAGRPLWVLLLGGVFERHPQLKYACTENAAWWVAELLRAADDTWEGSRHSTQKFGVEVFRAGLSMKPSEYMGRNCWLGVGLSTPYDAERVHEIGVANLMWGTDFPHPEGTWPHTRARLHEYLGALTPVEIKQVVGLNALEVYTHFDRRTLESIAQRIGPPVDAVAA